MNTNKKKQSGWFYSCAFVFIRGPMVFSQIDLRPVVS